MLPYVNLKSTLLLCRNLPSKTVVLNESNFAPQVITESRASGGGAGGNAAGTPPVEAGVHGTSYKAWGGPHKQDED